MMRLTTSNSNKMVPTSGFPDAETEKTEKKSEEVNAACKKTDSGVTSVQLVLIRRGKISFRNLSNTFKAARFHSFARICFKVDHS